MSNQYDEFKTKVISLLDDSLSSKPYIDPTIVIIALVVFICFGIGILSFVFAQIENEIHQFDNTNNNNDDNNLGHEISNYNESLTSIEIQNYNEPYLGAWDDVSNEIKQKTLFWKGDDADLSNHVKFNDDDNDKDYDEIIDFYGSDSMLSPVPEFEESKTQQQQQQQNVPKLEDFLGLNFNQLPSSPDPFCNGVLTSPNNNDNIQIDSNSSSFAQKSPQPNNYPNDIPQLQINSFKYSNEVVQIIEDYIGGGKIDNLETKFLPTIENLKDLVKFGSNNLNSYLAKNYNLTFPKFDKGPKFKPYDFKNIDFQNFIKLFDNYNLINNPQKDENSTIIKLKTFRYFMGLDKYHDLFLNKLIINVSLIYELIILDNNKINEEIKVIIFKILSDAFTDDCSIEITVNFIYTILLGFLKRLTKIEDKKCMEYQFGIISISKIINTLSVEDFNEFLLDDMFKHILSFFPNGIFNNFNIINEFNINKLMNTFMEILKIDLLIRFKSMFDINDFNGIIKFVKIIHDNLQEICNKYSFLNSKSIELLFTWIWIKSKRNQFKLQLLNSNSKLNLNKLVVVNSMNDNKFKFKLIKRSRH